MAAEPSAHREREDNKVNDGKEIVSTITKNRDRKHNQFRLNKPVFFCGRLLLGIIFILASVDKILHPAAFAQVVHNYQILPNELINLSAITLPWLELVLGFLLVSGLLFSGSIILGNLLLATFLGALVFNIARGLDIHCGCFSTNMAGNPATTWYLFRDSALLSLGMYLLFRGVLQGHSHD